MYNTELWYRYGPPGVLIIILESHVGITCASLPYMRYLFTFISTNYFSGPVYGASKDPTKAKHPESSDRDHPLVEFGGCGGKPVTGEHRVIVGSLGNENSEEDLGIYGGRTRAMEDHMLSNVQAWSVKDRESFDRARAAHMV